MYGTLVCMYADFGCMYAETVGCKVCGCWVHSMRLSGAKYAVVGAKYAFVGCKYADVGCKHAETLGCNVCGCWVQVYGAVGCLPDCR